MPTNTTYMGVPNPTVGGDANTWGTSLNTCITGFDALAVYNVHAVSISGTLSIFNGPVLIKASSAGGITLTLPDATDGGAIPNPNQGRVYVFVKVDSPVGILTINTGGGQTISGQSSVTIATQWNGLKIQSDGANWVVIGVVDFSAVTGILDVAAGGTGSDLSTTGGAHQVLQQSTLGGNVTVGQLGFTDLSGTISGTQISNSTITIAMLSSVEGNGTKVQLTNQGTVVSGDVVTYDANGNVQDSGTLLSSLAPLANPVFTGEVTAPIYVVGGVSSPPVTEPTISSGTGTPEAAVTAVIGSVYLRTDGTTSSSVYAKTQGSGNTGWGTLVPRVASADATAQSASISTTTLYAVPSTGAAAYRIDYYIKVTTAATTSSSLILALTYTDRDDSTVLTFNTTTPLNATDETGVQSGSIIVDAQASTNIQYATTYASTGATAMQYKLRIRVEAI